MIEPRLERLVTIVKTYQELNKLSDGEFAVLLGIDRSTWSYISNFKREPGAKFFEGLGKVRELRMALYEYFSQDEAQVDNKKIEVASAPPAQA
jgi:transcriptional regulator with XRE-family HTH domain